VVRLPHRQRIYRRHAVERGKRLFWQKRKSRTSALRRFMSSTKKTTQDFDPIHSSPEADAAVAVAVAGAEAAVAAGVEVAEALEAAVAAAGVEVAEALEAAAGVEVAAAVELVEAAAGFGPMGAAEPVWRALDVRQSGGVSRRRLQCMPIRRRAGRRCRG
jgi:hypothetical protein